MSTTPTTFETPGETAIRLALQSADVSVETWDAAVTEVELIPRRDDDATREAMAGVRVESRGRARGSEILVEESKRRFGFSLHEPRFDIRIRCPHGASIDASSGSSDLVLRGAIGDLTVKSGSGDVSAETARGTVRVTGASGDVSIDAAEGPVTVHTASGDVEIRGAGDRLTVNAVSGDVRVDDARAGVTVTSVSGDVSLSVAGGDAKVQTVSGDVEIAVRDGLGVWIDASSVSGEMVSELELEDGPAGEGGAAIELRVKTVSGDVRIRRSGAVRS